MNELKIQKIDISLLKPYPNNAKEHPQEQVEKIKKSIVEFGFNVPIIVDKEYNIIAGHGRYLALTDLGKTEVEIVIKNNLTEEQITAYRIADNKTAESDWILDMLKEEMSSIKELNYDLLNTGFNQSEIDNLYTLDNLGDNSPGEANNCNRDDVIVIQFNSPDETKFVKEFFNVDFSKKSIDGEVARQVIAEKLYKTKTDKIL